MRLIRVLASAGLLVIGSGTLPAGTSALSCVRPWGADDLAAARMVLTEGFGAGDFDGFLVAKVVKTARGLSGRVSDLDLEVSVAFDAVVPRDLHLLVGPHGPLTAFESSRTYFLTLHETTDPALPPLFVDPCGPAFEVSSPAELDFLLGLRSDETVIDDGLLSELRQSFLPPRFQVPVLAVAGATVALGVIAAVFLGASRRRVTSPSP